MIRDQIKRLIKKAIKQVLKEKLLPDFRMPEIRLEHPTEEAHGDYSTNVAMIIKEVKSQKLKVKSPVEIAKVISDKLKVKGQKLFEKVEVAGPGFINFTLSESWLQKQIGEIFVTYQRMYESNSNIRIRKFVLIRKFADKKVQVEFISANPTGPLHLGHGRGAFVGDTLANVLEAAGFDVKREYYINDAKKSGQIRELGRTVLGRGRVYLTKYLKEKIKEFKSYQRMYESNSNIRIRKFVAIRKFADNEEEAGYLLAQEIQKDIKKFITYKLKIKFDRWVSEEKLYQEGKVDKIERVLRKKKLVYEKEGAVWLKTTKFGDDKDRVLIKKDGQPTYLLPDIAYHKDKFDRRFAKIIDIWGADHLGHIKPLKIGLKTLGYDLKNLEILISQMVRLKIEGKIYKMSKRKGEVINLEWLIDEVGLDAARFLYLMKSLDSQMEFDLDLAKERSEKNPVYYVQYAYARICSILRKVENYQRIYESNSNIRIRKFVLIRKFADRLTHPSELDLIRQLIKFPEVVEDTAKDYQVQRLPHYALEVASRFHYFYKCCRVRTEDKDLMKARLALVLATQIVLKNMLGLMGIHAPSKM